jgi:PucR family transcriptional regulator, purine catabolism regulatory protein
LVEITDYGFAAITRLKVDDALVADVERLGWALAVGSPTEFGGLAEAYRRTSSLRGRVRSGGHSVRVDDATWSLAGLLGNEAGAMLAARLLAPVLALEPERRDALLRILRAWLGANGSWDSTAKATGLHRNSLRRHVGTLAEILELDLNQAQVRAELWIALQYTGDLPGMQAGTPAGMPGGSAAARVEAGVQPPQAR